MSNDNKTPEQLKQEAENLNNKIKTVEYVIDTSKLNELDSTEKLLDLVRFLLTGINIRIPSTLEGIDKVKYLLKEVK